MSDLFCLWPAQRCPRAPAISVVATSYNTGEFLAAALESVLRQSLIDFEVVLVDDASTDDTFSIAQSIARRDARIQVVRHATNLGAGAARNTALKRARGDLVSFLDTDDIWEDAFLEEMSQALAAQGDTCAGVFCYSPSYLARRIVQRGSDQSAARTVRPPPNDGGTLPARERQRTHDSSGMSRRRWENSRRWRSARTRRCGSESRPSLRDRISIAFRGSSCAIAIVRKDFERATPERDWRRSNIGSAAMPRR